MHEITTFSHAAERALRNPAAAVWLALLRALADRQPPEAPRELLAVSAVIDLRRPALHLPDVGRRYRRAAYRGFLGHPRLAPGGVGQSLHVEGNRARAVYLVSDDLDAWHDWPELALAAAATAYAELARLNARRPGPPLTPLDLVFVARRLYLTEAGLAASKHARLTLPPLEQPTVPAAAAAAGGDAAWADFLATLPWGETP